jgi:Protein of unknown function (DUF2924)
MSLLRRSEQSVHGLWGNDLREEDAAVDDVVRIEIESLRKLKGGELRTRYRDVFGEPSASFNREHLFRRIAWRLQAEAEGDLSERARRRATELANDSDLRWRAPQSFWREMERQGDAPDRDPRLPPVGTELERVYHGQILRVTVLGGRATLWSPLLCAMWRTDAERIQLAAGPRSSVLCLPK